VEGAVVGNVRKNSTGRNPLPLIGVTRCVAGRKYSPVSIENKQPERKKTANILFSKGQFHATLRSQIFRRNMLFTLHIYESVKNTRFVDKDVSKL
jgi:hypothetical protein